MMMLKLRAGDPPRRCCQQFDSGGCYDGIEYLMAARADVPRVPVRSGLGSIRGVTFRSLVIRDCQCSLVVPSKVEAVSRLVAQYMDISRLTRTRKSQRFCRKLMRRYFGPAAFLRMILDS